MEKIEELYSKLDNAIEEYTNERISNKKFRDIIKELNNNTLDIRIDEDIISDNRADFNECDYVSYDETSYNDEE